MWWWVLPAALLIGAVAWATTGWLLQNLDKLPVAEQISARIEAARTALAAAACIGGAPWRAAEVRIRGDSRTLWRRGTSKIP